MKPKFRAVLYDILHHYISNETCEIVHPEFKDRMIDQFNGGIKYSFIEVWRKHGEVTGRTKAECFRYAQSIIEHKGVADCHILFISKN